MMSMIAQIAKLLGIREDQVDGTLKSDHDARRFLSRRGLLLGAVGAAAGVVVPAAPLVQVPEQLVIAKKFVFEASWGKSFAAIDAYMRFKHADGSMIAVRSSP